MPRQNLTSNACTVCRKKRTKCDGRQPCRRCVTRGEECVYEDKMWRTKDHLRSEIGRLRRELQLHQDLIMALTRGGTAGDWENIHSWMLRGDPPERIAAWINSSRSPSGPEWDDAVPQRKEQSPVSPESFHPSISPRSRQTSNGIAHTTPSDAVSSPQSPLGDACCTCVPCAVSPTVSGASESSVTRTFPQPRSSLSQHSQNHMSSKCLRTWTTVTQDSEFLQRLLYHYFAHCFSDFSFICIELFMKDLKEGIGEYCSSSLVNAMLGLASQSYDTSRDSRPCSSLGHEFLAEANKLLPKTGDDEPSIPDIQATGVLALAEANVGNDEAAYQLATDCARKSILWKLKTDLGAQSDDPGQREAMATTFCGAFSLVRIFRILTGRLSCQTGPLFMRLTPDNDNTAIDAPAARVERGVALQQYFFHQLGRCSGLPKFINSVTETAHTFCSYHADNAVTPADLTPAYDKCLKAWDLFKNWLPKGCEMSKDVLFAQIWYNYIMTVLCSTLLDSLVDLRCGVTPRTVVVQASETIIFLAGVYQDRYDFLSVHPLLPHMVFAATLVQLRRSLDDNNEQVVSGTDGDDKVHLAPLIPSAGSSGVLNRRALPRDIDRGRSPRQASSPVNFVYPSWVQHVTPATLHQSGVTNPDIKRDPDPGSPATYVWPHKQASVLTAEGTLYLTQMGTTNRKAAELAKALQARGSTARRPAPPSTSTAGQSSLWTPPAWEPLGWGDEGRVGAGSNGIGVDSFHEFAALMSTGGGLCEEVGVMDQDGDQYAVTDVPGAQDGSPRGEGGSCASTYGEMYVYPESLPQMVCETAFDGYGPERMDGMGMAAFGGGMPG